MRRPRFTIAGLLGMVLFLAVGLAALRSADNAWDSGVLGVTLTVLLISTLLAIHREGDRRAHWIGFALFGWAYLLASLLPTIEARLPTTKLLALLDSSLGARSWLNSVAEAIDRSDPSWARPSSRTLVYSTYDGTMLATSQGVDRLWDATTGSPLGVRSGTPGGFVRIGHSLLALVLALVGGSLSRRLYSSGHPGRDAEPNVPRRSPAGPDDA